MSTCQFSPGQRFLWQGSLMEVKRLLLTEQKVNLENLGTGALLLLEISTLVTALFSGELIFENNGDAYRTRKPIPDLSCYPSEAVEAARWRLKVIEPLLSLPERDVTRDLVQQRVNEFKSATTEASASRYTYTTAISKASVYRWLKAYQQSGNDIRALLPKLETRGGNGKSRLSPEMNALIDAILKAQCYRPEKVALDDLVALIAARIEDENRLRSKADHLSMPSRATIARRIETLNVREIVAAQQGKRTARRKFTQAEKMNYPQLPYERVEIDHTRCDLVVIDERDNLPLGRPTLTYSLDMATRYPLGYYLGFEPPSYFTVMECLYQAICPKSSTRDKYGTEHEWLAYGVPGTLVIDNGKEFIGKDLSDACDILGIVLQQCPIMTPELKAGVERHFGTLNSGVFHTLPGTTFSNIFQRGEYDSVQQACISLDELEKALVLFLVDIYAERYQHGLKDIPARCWEKALETHFAPRLPPSRDELAILLGRVEWRTLQASGIEFECLRYNATDLGELRVHLKGEKVKLKYHPGDLSRIYIFDPFEKCYHEVPALDQEYTQGLSFWKHRLIRRVAAQEIDQVDLAALGRARRKIQELVDRARSRKKTSTRSKVARWDGKSSSLLDSARGQFPSTHQLSQPINPNQSSTPSETEVYEFDYNLPPNRRDE